MVVEENGLYRCEACSFRYEEQGLAERCEAFCREHNACDPDIIAQAVENTERAG